MSLDKSNPTYNPNNKRNPMNKKMQHHHTRNSTKETIYNQSLITTTVSLGISTIGNNLKETLTKAISTQIEGKCIVNGYIKPKSVEVLTFSSGLLIGSNVNFEVVIQCDVCLPVEGMYINCIAKNINKAGVRAELNHTPTPVVIFIARDHNYSSPLFSEIKENDEIKVRVIGQRFELNDKYISIIAEIVESVESETSKPQPQPQPQVKENLIENQDYLQLSTLTSLPIVNLPLNNEQPPPSLLPPSSLLPPPSSFPIPSKKKTTIKIKKPKITIMN